MKRTNLFLIIGAVIVFLFLIGAMWIMATPKEAPRPPQVPVCGNGIIEPGETYQTCCLDAGCPEGLECINNTCITREAPKEVEKAETTLIGFGDAFLTNNVRLNELKDILVLQVPRFSNDSADIVVYWMFGEPSHLSVEQGKSISERYIRFTYLGMRNNAAFLVLTEDTKIVNLKKTFVLLFGEAARVNGTNDVIEFVSVDGEPLVRTGKIGNPGKSRKVAVGEPFSFDNMNAELTYLKGDKAYFVVWRGEI
ncbi:MAG: hypothetical protein J7K68_01660 [Candidatus Diapherotrites archaeon]|nr:hypothetical protein [Candidatus Diapherotrites archaeon]